MMRQHSRLFEQLKATEKIKAYMAHGSDYQKELLTKLEVAKAIEVATQKVTVKGMGLLRKTELKNDMLQIEIRQLKLDMTTLESSKARTEEESAQLKSKLEQTVFGFAKEKKELKAAYQQQVDDMFFYGYCCYMKKYGITDDIPNIPLDKEDEVELGVVVGQKDNSRVEDKSAVTSHEDQDTT